MWRCCHQKEETNNEVSFSEATRRVFLEPDERKNQMISALIKRSNGSLVKLQRDDKIWLDAAGNYHLARKEVTSDYDVRAREVAERHTNIIARREDELHFLSERIAKALREAKQTGVLADDLSADLLAQGKHELELYRLREIAALAVDYTETTRTTEIVLPPLVFMQFPLFDCPVMYVPLNAPLGEGGQTSTRVEALRRQESIPAYSQALDSTSPISLSLASEWM